MNAPKPIVLLGGGGLGPWAWNRLTPLMEQKGFFVTTPTLRATGDDKTPPEGVTLSDWVDDLSAAVAPLNDAVLIAHSFAGYVAAGALGRINCCLSSIIFLDAMLPKPGMSWFESVGPQTEEFMRGIAQNGATPWFTRDQLDQIYPNNGITNSDFVWMSAHLTPQPLGTYTQPAIDRPLEDLAMGVELNYVKCLRTQPPAEPTITLQTRDWSVSSIDTSHWPMITAPEYTADHIIRIMKP